MKRGAEIGKGSGFDFQAGSHFVAAEGLEMLGAGGEGAGNVERGD